MKHTATVMVAISPEQYQRCADYCASMGFPNVPMTFPTLYLEDAKRAVRGVMSRRPSDDAVIVGRAVADSGARMIQLSVAFETMLRNMHVATYFVPVLHGTKLEKLLEKLYDTPPYAIDDQHTWYRRDIGMSGRA